MHSKEHQADIQFRILCKAWERLDQDQKDAIERLAKAHTKPSRDQIFLIVTSFLYVAIWFMFNHNQVGTFAAVTISPLILFYLVHLGGIIFKILRINN
jgi:hypothetical protein